MSTFAPAHSLFDAPAEQPIDGALGWVEGILLGPLAVSLCVIAVAIVGFTMLTGRLPIRQGLRVVLGCFVLLGARSIVGTIMGAWVDAGEAAPVRPAGPQMIYEREPLPEATYDPYAGASLRRE